MATLSKGCKPDNFKHSNKKQKDSLVWVLIVAELKFLKILIPRLSQNTSNVNIESTIKIKTTVLFMWRTAWSPDLSLLYFSDIDLFLIDYACCKLAINGCSSLRTTPGA